MLTGGGGKEEARDEEGEKKTRSMGVLTQKEEKMEAEEDVEMDKKEMCMQYQFLDYSKLQL